VSEKGKPHRLILCNDGGTLVGPTLEAPMGEQGLVNLTIGPLLDTQIDTLYWQLGVDPYKGTPSRRFSDYYLHNTNVGPRWGDDVDRFHSAGAWRIYENAREIMEAGTDPPAVVIDHGHRHGLDVFLSMRVNDIHDGWLEDGDPLISPMKRNHPDWLLGVADNPEESSRFRGLSRFAYDFGVKEVRDYRLALAREAIENYDVDGFDWDFCRFPRFFRPGTARENAPLMTEMMRSIRRALDEKSAKAGRPLQLSVRVPPTFELALGSGLDVRTWIDEGLIDILIAGVVHTSLHRVPVEEFVDAAQGTGVQVVAQNLGLFWFGRPYSASILFGEPNVFSTEMCRASAATYWQAGVDGLYLWNNHMIPFNRDIEYNRRQWKEIADPDLLAGLDKHYLVDSPPDWRSFAAELDAPPVPQGPLPVELAEPGESASFRIDVVDDVRSAAGNGSLLDATLRLMIVHLTGLDEITIRLNGETLDRNTACTRLLYNECWLDFDVSADPALRRGWNDVEIEIVSRNPYIEAPLGIQSIEAIVRHVSGDAR
jgi:hypothetical protein